jgi:PAS domain S-box-containing protein
VSAPVSRSTGLEEILDSVPTPILLLERDTARVLFANRAATVLGAPAEHPCEDREGRPIPLDELPGVRAARGERIENEVVDWLHPAGRRTLQVSSDTIGQTVVLAFEDVTALEVERRRSRSLADATTALAGARGFQETLEALADVLVPTLADWCFVELVQDDGSIKRTVIRGADPEKHAAAVEYDKRFPLDPEAPAGSAAVIRSGEPEMTPEIPEGFYETVTSDPAYLAVLRDLDFRSFLIVPLRIGSHVVGDIALAQSQSGRRFGPEDVPVAQALADRCSLFLANARLYTEMVAAREELEAILGGVADAVVAQDTQGQIVFANAAAVEMFGFPSAELLLMAPVEDIRARFSFVTPDQRPVGPEDLPGRKALQGLDPEPMTLRYRPATGGPERWTRIKARGLRGPDGGVRMAITVIEDITELKQTELTQRFLAEASRLLADSLDYEATLTRVAELAVPEIADWCAVDLAAPGGAKRVTTKHVDPAKLALAEELARRLPTDPRDDRGVTRVLRTGEAELYPLIPDELLTEGAVDEEHLALIRSVGLVSAMIVPMRVRDQVLGAITFVSAESGRRFGAHDLELAEDLALRAATAIENARLYGQRSAIAQTLQASLLPPVLPLAPRLEFGAFFRAAGEGFDVGGDFYDVFSTAEDEWVAVIGDVCGKGAEAAATTALVRYTVRAAAARRRSPAGILRWLNEAMLRQRDSLPAARRFCTIALVRLDLRDEAVRVVAASGGHPLPRLLRADGSVARLGEPGTLVGVTEELAVTDVNARLAPGDTLVLYTDGLIEAGAPRRLWTPSDLDEALRQAGSGGGEGLQRVVDQLAAAALGDLAADPRDDVAVLAVRAC